MVQNDNGGSGHRAPLRARPLMGMGTSDDVIAQFRLLFAESPEAAAPLSNARNLDAAAEQMERIGARHGIATSASELRGFVRRLRLEMAAPSEMTEADLDAISAGGANDAEADFELTLMMSSIGFQKA